MLPITMDSDSKVFFMGLFISTALCPDLSNPANGMVTVMGTSVGDTASYTCNDGFELIGSMSVTCTSDGTWSDEPPMCRRKQFTLHKYFIPGHTV